MSNVSAASCIMPPKIIENALQDSHPIFSTTENEASIKDPFGSAFLKNNEEVNVDMWLEDAIRLPPTSLIPDSNFEHGTSETGLLIVHIFVLILNSFFKLFGSDKIYSCV